jgi:HEAT repeat protein
MERILLARIISTDDDLVRRSALEAMGFSSRKEMERLIADAFEESDPDWVASALVAMGRSASEDWEMHILRSLFHPDNVVRLEAIRAAGALSITRAVEPMLEMLDGTEPNKEVRLAAIWSLSEIGGEKANAALEALLDNAISDEEAEYIEEAIENLGSENGPLGLDLLDLKELAGSSSHFADSDDGEDEEYDDNLDGYEDEEADYDEDLSSNQG